MARPRPTISDFNASLLGLRERQGRELAILGCAALELVLEVSIRAKLENEEPAYVERLFDGQGSVAGTLSAKVDLTRALGLISPAVARDMHILRRIRNDFAHSFDDLDLDASPMKDRIDELTIWKGPDIPASFGFEQKVSESRSSLVFPDGRIEELDADHWVIVDQAGRVGLYVPCAPAKAAPPRLDVVRYEIWALVYCAALGGIAHWASPAGVPASP